jgi:hypothetical protein
MLTHSALGIVITVILSLPKLTLLWILASCPTSQSLVMIFQVLDKSNLSLMASHFFLACFSMECLSMISSFLTLLP